MSRMISNGAFALIASSILTPNVVFAKLGDQLWRTTTSSPGITAIDVDNTTVIVGSKSSHGYGSAFRQGSAHLLDAETGDCLRMLLPADRDNAEYFGSSVAIESGIAAVGAPWDTSSGIYAGSAYLFDVDSGNLITKLNPVGSINERSQDQYGFALDMSASRVLVGSVYEQHTNDSRTGATYIYDTTGAELTKITPANGAFFSTGVFGRAIALDGDRAVVGRAYGADVIDINTTSIVRPLLVENRHFADGFGLDLALDGNTALVAARFTDVQGSDSGAVYVFDITTGEMISKLIPEDGTAGGEFGFSLALEGDLALVGANHNALNQRADGAAYLFNVRTGKQIAKLSTDDPQLRQAFGFSVALSNGIAYVSANVSTSGSSGYRFGSVYAFDAKVVPEPSGALLLFTVLLTYASCRPRWRC